MPPDSELIVSDAASSIPEDHWCRGCPWAVNMIDRFVCPFVEGSCARVPETIIEPDMEKLRTKLQIKEYLQKC